MASSITKLLASSSIPARFVRPVAAVTCRFYTTQYFQLNDRAQCECILTPPSTCSSALVRDYINDAFCERLSATRNLAQILNYFDQRDLHLECETGNCPRWDVMEDDTALYLVRDQSGLPKKGLVEVDHKNPNELKNVFGCVRIHRYTNEIKIIVGKNGPNPGAAYLGYLIMLYSAGIGQTGDIKMITKNEMLKITIPKKKKGKCIRTIFMNLQFCKEIDM